MKKTIIASILITTIFATSCTEKSASTEIKSCDNRTDQLVNADVNDILKNVLGMNQNELKIGADIALVKQYDKTAEDFLVNEKSTDNFKNTGEKNKIFWEVFYMD